MLPLAGQVRSATPAAFGGRADLRNDAVRGYALLRSFLSKPSPGEALEECIQREFVSSRPGAGRSQALAYLR